MDRIFFLIDTNIFIQLEDNQIVKEAFTKFHNLCNENSAVICVHPLSKKDIQRDLDKQRKKKILSKIRKYKILEELPITDRATLNNLFGVTKSSNDEIDCQLLYALQKHAVHFLVTEDKGIHQRAKKASLKQKVLIVNQANNMLERLFPTEVDIFLPNIQCQHLYKINDKDKIFDSLREDYTDFQNWLEKCSKAQVKSWIVRSLNSNKLEAICIYKEAKEKDYAVYSLPKKSLKLATFKVDESYRGQKLGELMLKKAFLYSVENKFACCWMTAFPKHEVLIDFIKDFGFDEIGETNLTDKKTKKKELVFKKILVKPDSSELEGLDYHIKYSPFYDDRDNIGKYIIPIQEKYYHTLFPEKKIQLSFPGTENEIPGNTIKKVYLCHASTKQLKYSDLLFFYVSHPIQAVTSVGIIESVFRSNKLHEVISYIGKRSVYSFSEIEEMTQQNVLVIAFRFIKHLNQEVSLRILKEQQIIEAPPRSIQKLKSYKKLKQIIGIE